MIDRVALRQEVMKPLTLDDFPDRFEGPDDPRFVPILRIALPDRTLLWRHREFVSLGPSRFPIPEGYLSGFVILIGQFKTTRKRSPEARPLQDGLLHDVEHVPGTKHDALLVVDPKIHISDVVQRMLKMESVPELNANPDLASEFEAKAIRRLRWRWAIQSDKGAFERWWEWIPAGTPWTPLVKDQPWSA